jgi:hypothetical protein
MHAYARMFDLSASMSRNDNRKLTICDNRILTTLCMDNIWDDKGIIPDAEGIVVFLHIRKGFGNLPASVLLFLVFLVFPGSELNNL